MTTMDSDCIYFFPEEVGHRDFDSKGGFLLFSSSDDRNGERDDTFLDNEEHLFLGKGTYAATYKVNGWLLPTYSSPFDHYHTDANLPCCIKVYGNGFEKLTVAAQKDEAQTEYKRLLVADGAKGHTPRAIARGTLRREQSDKPLYYAIVMEYLPLKESTALHLLDPKAGYDIRNDITRGTSEPPTPLQTAVFALSLCRAIKALHSSAGAPHRDLKPDNIAVQIGSSKVTPFYKGPRHHQKDVKTETIESVTRVFLVDLGNLASSDNKATVLGPNHYGHFASQSYGAPELFDFGFDLSGNPVAGPLHKYKASCSVDTYSIGCIVYWFVTGSSPSHESNYRKNAPLPDSIVNDEWRKRYMYCKYDGVVLEPWIAAKRNLTSKHWKRIDFDIADMLCRFVSDCTIYDPVKRAKAISVEQMEQQLAEALGLKTAVSTSTKLISDYPTELFPLESGAHGTDASSPALFDHTENARGKAAKHLRVTPVSSGFQNVKSAEKEAPSTHLLAIEDNGRREYVQASKLTNTRPQEAADLLRQSYAKGYVEAYAALGDILATEKVRPANAEEAKEALLAAGHNRNAYAMYKLGEWFETGKNLGRVSDADAMACYSVATDLGDTDAAFELGRMYIEAGKATHDNTLRQEYWNEAHKLFSRICKENPYGYLGLGWIYEYGYGVRINGTTARRMYRAAANTDDPVEEACEKLAWPQGRVSRALVRTLWGMVSCGPPIFYVAYFALLWVGIATVVDTHTSVLATYGEPKFWAFWSILEALPVLTVVLGCHIGRYGAYRVTKVTRALCVVSSGICAHALWSAGFLPFLPSATMAVPLGVIVGLILQHISR